MRAIAIEFGRKRVAPGRLAGVVLLVVATGVLVAQGWVFFTLQAEADAWQVDRRRLDRIAAAPRVQESAENREKLQAELRFANRVIDKLDMPWDALFGTVEAAGGDDAILLGIEPDAERRDVRLMGEAKDTEAMLAYLRELRRAPALRNAHLTGHQVNAQDPQRPVRFTIEAHWMEPPARKADTEGSAGEDSAAAPTPAKTEAAGGTHS